MGYKAYLAYYKMKNRISTLKGIIKQFLVYLLASLIFISIILFQIIKIVTIACLLGYGFSIGYLISQHWSFW